MRQIKILDILILNWGWSNKTKSQGSRQCSSSDRGVLAAAQVNYAGRCECLLWDGNIQMAGASKQLPEKTNKAHGNYVEQLPCIYCFPDSTRFAASSTRLAASSTRLAATRRRGGGRGHARALQEPLLQPPEPQFANAATVGSPVQGHFAHAKLEWKISRVIKPLSKRRARNASFTSSYNRNCSNTTEQQLQLADSTNLLCKG